MNLKLRIEKLERQAQSERLTSGRAFPETSKWLKTVLDDDNDNKSIDPDYFKEDSHNG